MKTSDGHLHTTLFHGRTDRNTLLWADSFHPPALKKNIPFAQFQSLKRIWDEEADFEAKAKEMQTRFLNRGYKCRTMNEACSKAKKLKRQEKKQQERKNQNNKSYTCDTI